MKTRKSLLWLATIMLAALIFIASPVAVAEETASAGGDWPHFGYDDAYTAYNPVESTISITNVVELERRWGLGCGNYDYFGNIARVPAIYGNTLYVSGMSTGLNAYDARTGALKWQFGTGNTWMPQPVVSEDGVVFYMQGSNPTYLYAVNGQTGAELWQAPLGFELGYSGATEAVVTVDEARDLVYLVEEPFIGDGKLYAIDKQTGNIAWYMDEFKHDANFKNNYALLRDGKLYAAAEIPITAYPFTAEHMLRIDPVSQTIEMTYTLPVSGTSYYKVEQFTLCNDRLVVGYDYQYDPVKPLVAYDIVSPTIQWKKTFTDTIITGKIACNTDTDRIYVPTDPYLYALDATTGDEVWKFLGYDAIYNPSIANGVVYFLSDNNMYALDEATGDRLLHYPLGHAADETTQVAIANGMVYFSGNGGTCDLFALWWPKAKIFLPLVLR